ncbi:MAG: hypothetical protein K2K77_02505, partial [Duncaniella sp.]|nr:hypothetical protein [Duncaniella sp.]
MTHVSHRLLGLALGLTAVSASATSPTLRQEAQDSLINNQHVMIIGPNKEANKDSIRSLIETFYLDQFRNYQDPAAPYFMFMSQDANMAMGVGGVVKMRAYFDPGNSMPGSSFSPYNVPMSYNPLDRNHLGTTASGTSLFLRLIGRNTRIGSYQLYIQGKFDGYQGKGFYLSKAFATVNDWTVGYATSTFSDGLAIAPTVDANGSTMSMDFSALLVRWNHQFKHGISMAASVETPEMSVPTDDPNIGVRSMSVPNFSAMVQYQWAPDQHVRLSAITRVLPYRDMVNGRNHSPMGYGFQLSTVFNPTRALTVYAIGN